MKYKMSWTQKDGVKVENQIFTAEYVSRKLAELESYGCKNIKIESVETNGFKVRVNDHGWVTLCEMVDGEWRDCVFQTEQDAQDALDRYLDFYRNAYDHETCGRIIEL